MRGPLLCFPLLALLCYRTIHTSVSTSLIHSAAGLPADRVAGQGCTGDPIPLSVFLSYTRTLSHTHAISLHGCRRVEPRRALPGVWFTAHTPRTHSYSKLWCFVLAHAVRVVLEVVRSYY